MPVFDFSGASDKKPGVQSECTYTTFQSNEKETSPEKPIMILDNSSCQWKHHSCGIFTNPIKRTSFEFKEDDGVFSADIISIDSRFVSLLKWLGENHINVRLSGENKENGYAVYKIRETAFGGGTKLSAEDGFLQFMIERLLASSAPAELVEDEDEEEIKEKTTKNTPIPTSSVTPTKSTQTTNAVKTGDNTPIGIFVILLIAAIVVIGGGIYLKRRKK